MLFKVLRIFTSCQSAARYRDGQAIGARLFTHPFIRALNVERSKEGFAIAKNKGRMGGHKLVIPYP